MRSARVSHIVPVPVIWICFAALQASPVQGDVLYELQELSSPDPLFNSSFGSAVSVHGPWIVVGAPLADSNTGVVHLFRLDDGGTPSIPSDDSWVYEGEIVGSDTEASDLFGGAVSVKESRAIVGAHGDDDQGPSTGSAYVFRRDDNGTPLDESDDSWIEEDKLTATDATSNDYFGRSVGIDGDWAVAGADIAADLGVQTGAAYVFRRDDNDTPDNPDDDFWTQADKLVASDAGQAHFFGGSVAISGDWLVVGATGDADYGSRSGAAYVFRRDDNGTPFDLTDDLWIEHCKLVASDAAPYLFFGGDVSITGGHLVVGCLDSELPGEEREAAYVFWRDDQGTPSVLSDDLWVEQARLTASDGVMDEHFGWSVSISNDLMVAGSREHVRRLCTDTRDYCADDTDCTAGMCEASGNPCHTIEDCEPGQCSGSPDPCHYPWDCPDLEYCDSPPAELCIGAATCGIRTGAAYVYRLHDNGTPTSGDDDLWVEESKLVATDGLGNDRLGSAVSVDNGRFVVGAPGVDDPVTGCGAAYVFSGEPSGEQIPTVSEWGLVAMMLLILTGGTLVLKRRRVAPA